MQKVLSSLWAPTAAPPLHSNTLYAAFQSVDTVDTH